MFSRLLPPATPAVGPWAGSLPVATPSFLLAVSARPVASNVSSSSLGLASRVPERPGSRMHATCQVAENGSSRGDTSSGRRAGPKKDKDVWRKGGPPTGQQDQGAKQGFTSRNRTRRPNQARRQPRDAPGETEQVVFKSPFPRDPRVAILGGGMSGLMCARELAGRGIRSTLFDTGKHGFGGRMATRELSFGGTDSSASWDSGGSEDRDPQDPQGQLLFDHAAQYFTVSDPKFAAQVARWKEKGWLREWQGCVGRLSAGGLFTELDTAASEPAGTSAQALGEARALAVAGVGGRAEQHQVIEAKAVAEEAVAVAERQSVVRADGSGREDSSIKISVNGCGRASGVEGRPGARYFGTGGMRQLSDNLAAAASSTGLVSLERPVWVTKMQYCEPQNNAEVARWRLVDEFNRDQGEFDFVVIAHNGKCANRLMGPAGVPLVAAQMKRMQLSSIWCSMIAFASPLPVPRSASGRPLEGAFVEGLPAVSWMGNNTAKYGHREWLGGVGHHTPSSRETVECWTVFSSAEYGKQNKVPQERVPAHVADRVKAEMLEGVCAALGIPRADLPPVAHHRVQLWGAALPLNAPGVEFVCDARARVAMCGDWLLNPSVEAAALSGMALAAQIAGFAREGGVLGEEQSVGLHTPLKKMPGAEDIGWFP